LLLPCMERSSEAQGWIWRTALLTFALSGSGAQRPMTDC
jgi:hypothetical protein